MKLLLTKELGRLARWLRILGLDTAYSREDIPARILLKALREQRTVITKNRLLFDKISVRAVYVKEEKLKEQLKAVVAVLGADIQREKMFSRCVVCNRPLYEVDKQENKDKIPAYVYKTQEKFTKCPECDRVYWPGSHWANTERALKALGII